MAFEAEFNVTVNLLPAIMLDDDVREKVLENLSTKEIAEEIKELDTDDAVDLLAELPPERKEKVIAQIDD